MHTRPRALLASACTIALMTLGAAPATAGTATTGHGRHGSHPQLERLDRGLVAATTPDGVFLSWRLLAQEATGHSATGLTGADFRVYRDGRPIATVTGSTNYLDAGGTATSRYRVGTLVRGKQVSLSAPATPWSGASRDIPLRKPRRPGSRRRRACAGAGRSTRSPRP